MVILLLAFTGSEEEMEEPPPQKQYFVRSNLVPGPLGGHLSLCGALLGGYVSIHGKSCLCYGVSEAVPSHKTGPKGKRHPCCIQNSHFALCAIF